MLRSEICCPRSNVDAAAGDRALPAQHNLGGLKALEEREQRGSWGQRPGLAIRRPNAIEHPLLEVPVPASMYMFGNSSDSWSSRSAVVAVANQPKICCAQDSAIEIATFPTWRV